MWQNFFLFDREASGYPRLYPQYHCRNNDGRNQFTKKLTTTGLFSGRFDRSVSLSAHVLVTPVFLRWSLKVFFLGDVPNPAPMWLFSQHLQLPILYYVYQWPCSFNHTAATRSNFYLLATGCHGNEPKFSEIFYWTKHVLFNSTPHSSHALYSTEWFTEKCINGREWKRWLMVIESPTLG